MPRVFGSAGHGGYDPGACAYGLEEADVNLNILLAFKAELESRGVEVVASRLTDEDDPVEQEVREANASGADVAVSFHTNAGGGDGSESFYYAGDPDGERLARLCEAHVQAIGQNSRGVKTNDLMFTRETRMTAVLCECAFVDNDADNDAIDTVAEQRALGVAYAKAVLEYLGIGAGGRGWVNQGGRWWYERDDGSYPADQWAEIGGAWYLFDESGWMTTGWQQVGDAWFWMGSDGAMRTGWFFSDGEWFFAGETGAIRTGFVEDGGELYLLHEKHDGRFGALDSGWIERGGRWMFGRQGGALARSMVCETSEGRWYAFDADGFMFEKPTVDGGGCILV